jgi:SAM-dependent methyltransferase
MAAGCIVCGGAAESRAVPWASECRACGTWRSSLAPAIGETTAYRLDEQARAQGLRLLRQRNFATVLDRIDAVRPLAGARLLDVGSAHGWFLDAAARRGAQAIGAEPDAELAENARAQGHTVLGGEFPQVLYGGERFDAITFNDVLEHIPAPVACLDACREHLDGGGTLSVNIPTSDGIVFRGALRLARVGARRPFERLWQRGLPSPHMHYFPRAALVRLIESRGFRIRQVAPLRAIVREGLWQRLHMYEQPGLVSPAGYVALSAAAPVLNTPRLCDIVHVVAQRD